MPHPHLRSILLRLLPGLFIAGCATVGTQRSAPPVDLAIFDVNVVDVEHGRVLRNHTVLISADTIHSVVPTTHRSSAGAATVISGGGGYLIPGLWDMHAHLRGNGIPAWLTTDWMMPLLIAHGVTGLRDMNSDCDGPREGPVCFEQMRAWQDSIEQRELLAPRIMALSSFQVNPPWDFNVTEEQVRALIGMLREKGHTSVKIYDRLSPQAFSWLMDAAKAQGLQAWGHVPLRVTTTAASDAGLRSVEHARDFLFDCFPGSASFRSSATSTTVPVDLMRMMIDQHNPSQCDQLFRTLVRNDTWYVPTHVTRRRDAFARDSAFRNDPRKRYLPPAMYADWIRNADRVTAIDSAARGRTFMDFYRKGAEITGAAHRAGLRIMLGTDGGDSFVFPGSAVHDELAELVSAGLSPADALRAATLSGAEFLGVADRYGTVEAGKRADLVLLDADPLELIANTRRIRAVILGGRVLDRERLDSLLLQVESAARRPLRPGDGS